MRVALAIAIATLTFGLAPRAMQEQMRTGYAPALETIHMVDWQTGWAVTDPRYISVLLRTTDGGSHWRDVTPRRPSGHKIHVWRTAVLSSQIAWVTPGDTTGTDASEIFRTIDGGRTWRNVVIPAPGVISISFINPREGWLLASFGAAMVKEELGIYRSTDGGDTWSAVARVTSQGGNSGLPFAGNKSSITFANPTMGWITGVDLPSNSLYLYVTHSGGRTWRKQNAPPLLVRTRHWLSFLQPPKFFTTRHGILPVIYSLLNNSLEQIGRVFVLFVTDDGGSTWTHTTPLRVSGSDLVHQAVADTNHAWVTNGRSLHATSDGGRRWLMIRSNPLFADVTQLDFVSPRLGWALRQKSPHLLKTLDGGRTWTSVTYQIVRQ